MAGFLFFGPGHGLPCPPATGQPVSIGGKQLIADASHGQNHRDGQQSRQPTVASAGQGPPYERKSLHSQVPASPRILNMHLPHEVGAVASVPLGDELLPADIDEHQAPIPSQISIMCNFSGAEWARPIVEYPGGIGSRVIGR